MQPFLNQPSKVSRHCILTIITMLTVVSVASLVV